MSDQPRKTFYHSEAVTLGPVTVKVLAEPTPSKHKKGEFFVKLEIDGRERYYTPENPSCLDFWKGQAGQTMTIIAEGSRDSATISYVGEPASQMQQPPPRQQGNPAPQRQQPPAQQQTRPPQQTQRPAAGQRPPAPVAKAPEQAMADAVHFIAKNLTLAKNALIASSGLKLQFEYVYKTPMPPELWTAIYNTLLYGSSGAGIIADLPQSMDFKAAAEQSLANLQKHYPDMFQGGES